MGAKEGYFKVTITNKEVISAPLPLQVLRLPQSNLDLTLPPIDVGVFFCYHKPENCTFVSMVQVLKTSLAQCLVTYYPLAGVVVQNSAAEPELLCNNRGVDFEEAYADIELSKLDLYNPDDSIEGKLVPNKKHGVFSVQATELRCGGVVVACTVDHRISDAYSTNMFLVSWAETAQSKPITMMPCLQRSLLHPRNPPQYYPSIDNIYVPVSALPPPPPSLEQPPSEDQHQEPLISRIYYISVDQLCKLQAEASTEESKKRTKLESFCGYLWKMVATAASTTINDNRRIKTKMGVVVDGRTRLYSFDDDELKAKLMQTYFGNMLSMPYGMQRLDDLTSKPVSWVAEYIHKFLQESITREHLLNVIDWVELHRPEQILANIYCSGTDDGPAVVVSSGQRFPVSKIDFGWGKPWFGSYHFPWGGDSGYVMPMPSPLGNGDWIVYMHLSRRELELIDVQASHIFKPVTSDYLSA